ncbi:hypothetical protein L873DRAFT_1808041 [Choiromyces venosus 120613-1]|uniref:Uncharacterized protein n=1 Tax=Choiromyces venosus 120613-1 TaxID=1336337 RepID=A0A3N4JJJ5_9PEZI|nr:hypothetical protein L873DRAFT_1808041 [Choiromyces venosus 120613-1]
MPIQHLNNKKKSSQNNKNNLKKGKSTPPPNTEFPNPPYKQKSQTSSTKMSNPEQLCIRSIELSNLKRAQGALEKKIKAKHRRHQMDVQSGDYSAKEIARKLGILCNVLDRMYEELHDFRRNIKELEEDRTVLEAVGVRVMIMRALVG